MEFRLAERRDRKSWLHVRRTLWPHGSVEAHEKDIAAGLAGEDGRLFVIVETEVERIALLECRVQAGTAGGGELPALHVDGWYIMPKYRGAETGQALQRALADWLRAKRHGALKPHPLLDGGVPLKTHLTEEFDDQPHLFAVRSRVLEVEE